MLFFSMLFASFGAVQTESFTAQVKVSFRHHFKAG